MKIISSNSTEVKAILLYNNHFKHKKYIDEYAQRFGLIYVEYKYYGNYTWRYVTKNNFISILTNMLNNKGITDIT